MTQSWFIIHNSATYEPGDVLAQYGNHTSLEDEHPTAGSGTLNLAEYSACFTLRYDICCTPHMFFVYTFSAGAMFVVRYIAGATKTNLLLIYLYTNSGPLMLPCAVFSGVFSGIILFTCLVSLIEMNSKMQIISRRIEHRYDRQCFENGVDDQTEELFKIKVGDQRLKGLETLKRV
jgi:hypothetical protein